jgi:hypothetical protein
MDWHALEKLKVDDLRAMAKEKAVVENVAGLSKEELVAKLAASLGIPRPHRVVEGADKGAIKARIRELKSERQKALEGGDHEGQRRARKAIHRQKRTLRRMAHRTH